MIQRYDGPATLVGPDGDAQAVDCSITVVRPPGGGLIEWEGKFTGADAFDLMGVDDVMLRLPDGREGRIRVVSMNPGTDAPVKFRAAGSPPL